MEMTELYFENENGQLEINFDSLAIITSEEFVSTIKKSLGDDIKRIKNVFVEGWSNSLFSIHVRTLSNVYSFEYYHDKEYNFTKIFVDKFSSYVLGKLGYKLEDHLI